MLAVLVAGYATLATLTDVETGQGVPPTASGLEPTVPNTAEAGAPTQAVAAPAQAGAETPGAGNVAGAVIGADGVARVEMPLGVAEGPAPDAAFQAEIDAYAAGVAATLPQSEGWDTFQSIEVAGRVIIHDHVIDIHLREYTLPITPRLEVVPNLEGWLCDGSTCFEFERAYANGPCAGDIRPLLDRGAVAVFRYQDVEGLPIATIAVEAGDCRN